MTARVRLVPGRHEFLVEGSDTILEAALRAGISLSYRCSNGNCGLCKARVISGQTRPVHHSDYVFTEAEKNRGYVLLCSHTAAGDVEIEVTEIAGAQDIPAQQIATCVRKIEPLGPDLALLHLQTPRTQRLQFLAGQSVTLETANGATAECPVASCPCDDRNLQFHLRHIPGDRFSDYVFGQLRAGDSVALTGPNGRFTLDEDSPRALIFIAHGTGFAPIKSLIEHATARDTPGSLHLYWIAGAGNHYLDNLCRSWTDALDNFRYTPLTVDAAGTEPVLEQIAQDHPDLGGFDIYAAGPGDFLNSVEKFLRDKKFPPDRLRTE